MFLSFVSSSVHMMYASHIWSSDRLGSPHPPTWSSCEAVMLCWPLIIMNLPALIASHKVGSSFRSRLFLSTGVKHIFCSCLTSPIWTRVFFMSSTNDLSSVRMIKSSLAMMHWLICTLVASVSNMKHALWFCQNSLEMKANFSKSSAGGTDLEVPICAVVTPEAARSPSAVLSGPLGLLLFQVPSPLSLD